MLQIWGLSFAFNKSTHGQIIVLLWFTTLLLLLSRLSLNLLTVCVMHLKVHCKTDRSDEITSFVLKDKLWLDTTIKMVWGQQRVCNIQGFGGFGVVAVSWFEKPRSPPAESHNAFVYPPECFMWWLLWNPSSSTRKTKYAVREREGLTSKTSHRWQGAVKSCTTMVASPQRCVVQLC